MSKINCLTDKAKLILAKIEAAKATRSVAFYNCSDRAIYDALSHLCDAVEMLVLNTDPLWEKKDSRDMEQDCE